MDDTSCKSSKYGGNELTNTEFLRDSVRLLSRLYVNKTKGQETIWKDNPPSDWPPDLTWDNPTSKHKDTVQILRKKFSFLISVVPPEKLTETQKKAFEDFKNGNTDSLKCYMFCKKYTKHIQELTDEFSLVCEDPSHPAVADLLLALKVLETKKTSLLPILEKSDNMDFKEVPCKKAKIHMVENQIRRQIKPKKKSQTSLRPLLPKPNHMSSIGFSKANVVSLSSNEALSFDCLHSTYTKPSATVSSSLLNTASSTSLLQPGLTNYGFSGAAFTELDQSSVTPLFQHADRFLQEDTDENMLNTNTACQNMICDQNFRKITDDSSQENILSHSLSIDSGTWSQENSHSTENKSGEIILNEHVLNTEYIQSSLSYIEQKVNITDFDPIIFMNF